MYSVSRRSTNIPTGAAKESGVAAPLLLSQSAVPLVKLPGLWPNTEIAAPPESGKESRAGKTSTR